MYLATDHRWYRWPDPRPYPSKEDAERQARPAYSTVTHAGQPWTPSNATGNGVGQAMGYLAALVVALPFLVAGVAWLVLPHDVESGCEGIGFGCTLSPADSAIFLAFTSLIVTVPGLVVAAVVMTVWARRSPRYAARSAASKAGRLVAVLAVLAAIRGVAELAYRLA